VQASIINIAYLVAAVLFIFGLKGLTHPRTAVRGNLIGALGMLIAIVATLVDQSIVSYTWLVIGLIIGTAIGATFAIRVEMTGMPEMVALFNGFGGGASVLVAGAELTYQATTTIAHHEAAVGAATQAADPVVASGALIQFLIATMLAGLIGAVTFWGSLVAYGKLAGYKWIPDGKLFPGHSGVTALLLAACVALTVLVVVDPGTWWTFWVLAVIASVLGLFLTVPIGGADMPVVIALLNSYSGLAGAATGFVINNNVLIIAGSLVGASGLILTSIMCKAMNRSLANVLFATLGPTEGAATADEVYAGKIKATSAEEVAMLLETARRVAIVPGYGMAVSQAQHAVRDLANMLESRGTEVEFAIHPVAGRMPGHMNVLLAEADIPYEKLKEMDVVNPSMAQVDVAIVVGANDVVNPVARTDPKSPIAGMPIIDVDKARTVVVIKRSLSPGFAGIPNPLFAMDNTLMFFSDGKKAFLDLVAAMKEL
jgi:NAD(P) transhydrogenase subunit beta